MSSPLLVHPTSLTWYNAYELQGIPFTKRNAPPRGSRGGHHYPKSETGKGQVSSFLNDLIQFILSSFHSSNWCCPSRLLFIEAILSSLFWDGHFFFFFFLPPRCNINCPIEGSKYRRRIRDDGGKHLHLKRRGESFVIPLRHRHPKKERMRWGSTVEWKATPSSKAENCNAPPSWLVLELSSPLIWRGTFSLLPVWVGHVLSFHFFELWCFLFSDEITASDLLLDRESSIVQRKKRNISLLAGGGRTEETQGKHHQKTLEKRSIFEERQDELHLLKQ